MRYGVVIERAGDNFSAYVPDLPGCVSVGDALEEVSANIHEAITLYLAQLREDGRAIPEPTTVVAYEEVT
ncbi:MAG: type II toxin-antitoxin system HicB family antitoxin [Holophagaceae bacterium]|nr:type II toxin-antitoxin system HicB family antitoxin [Holophagaceae bacterium]